MRKTTYRLLFELLIVFIGVLGAFTSDRIIQHQLEVNQYKETLKTLRTEITKDTLRLGNEIRSTQLKVRQKLARRFVAWLHLERAPKDSIDMVFNQMTYYQIPTNIINFKLLQIEQGINQISNIGLKSLLFEYYVEAEDTEKYYEKISEENMNAIVRLYDMKDFRFSAESATTKRLIALDKIDREIVNRALLYESQVNEVDLILRGHKARAANLLTMIGRELSE